MVSYTAGPFLEIRFLNLFLVDGALSEKVVTTLRELSVNLYLDVRLEANKKMYGYVSTVVTTSCCTSSVKLFYLSHLFGSGAKCKCYISQTVLCKYSLDLAKVLFDVTPWSQTLLSWFDVTFPYCNTDLL